jgi:predicted dehydrogenase
VLAPGRIARRWAHAVRTHTDHEIVAVASRSATRAAQFGDDFGIARRYADYDQLLGDGGLDAVYIASPNAFHLEHSLRAIEAGVPALVEKPLATSATDAVRIADAARAAGVYVAEGMWTRFLPQSVEIDRLLRSGRLGAVRSVHSALGTKRDFDPAARVFAPELGGGALLDLGVYTLWFARFALGAPRSVQARGTLAPTGVDDHVSVLLGHAEATATATVSLRTDLPRHSWISGDEGRIEFAASFKDPASFTVTVGTTTTGWDPPHEIVGFDGLAYQAAAMARDLGDARTESAEHGLSESIGILETIEGALSSMSDNREEDA